MQLQNQSSLGWRMRTSFDPSGCSRSQNILSEVDRSRSKHSLSEQSTTGRTRCGHKEILSDTWIVPYISWFVNLYVQLENREIIQLARRTHSFPKSPTAHSWSRRLEPREILVHEEQSGAQTCNPSGRVRSARDKATLQVNSDRSGQVYMEGIPQVIFVYVFFWVKESKSSAKYRKPSWLQEIHGFTTICDVIAGNRLPLLSECSRNLAVTAEVLHHVVLRFHANATPCK